MAIFRISRPVMGRLVGKIDWARQISAQKSSPLTLTYPEHKNVVNHRPFIVIRHCHVIRRSF